MPGLNAAHAKKLQMSEKLTSSEIRLFLENHALEFHEIWQKNTLGNK